MRVDPGRRSNHRQAAGTNGRTVNSLYFIVKRLRQSRSLPLLLFRIAVSDTTLLRRQNVLALFQAYAEQALAAGAPPKGLEQAFAAVLQVSPSMWSQIKSARPIGDKLARQIEVLCAKPAGWLDEDHPDAPPSPAEKDFMALALAAWRASNAAARKALRAQLQQQAMAARR